MTKTKTTPKTTTPQVVDPQTGITCENPPTVYFASPQPRINAESSLPDIIKFVLGKCVATLPEDIDNLTPKDRIMLWKEYGNFFEPEEAKLSQVPGGNIKTITVNILENGE